MAKGLFHLHLSAARRASRFLRFIFCLGIALGFVVYFLCAFLFYGAFLWVFSKEASASSLYWVAFCALLLGGVACSVVLGGYFRARSAFVRCTASELACSFGALPLREDTRHRRLKNVVEEMALASGLERPTVFYLPRHYGINAFVLGGRGRSVALLLTQGVFDYLDRDEQQAIVAHEFGHIRNEDVFVYAQLSAILSGFYALRYWGEGHGMASFTYENALWRGFWTYRFFSGFFYFLRRVLSFLGLSFWFFGRFVQARFSRQREWMADARAVQYTRNPEALLRVFKKLLALLYLRKKEASFPLHFAHCLFVFRSALWQTHPPLEARIARYGGRVSAREIEALAFKLKKRMAQTEVDVVERNYRRDARNNVLLPVLLVEEFYKKSVVLDFDDEALLFALFLFYGGPLWHCEDFLADLPLQRRKAIDLATQKIEALHPVTQLAFFMALLRRVPKEVLMKLKERFAKGSVSFYLFCYRLMLESVLCEKRFEDCGVEVVVDVLAFVVHHTHFENGYDVDTQKALLFDRLLRKAYPLREAIVLPDEALFKLENLSSFKVNLLRVKALSLARRQALWQALDVYWRKRGNFSLQEVYLRSTLSFLLLGK